MAFSDSHCHLDMCRPEQLNKLLQEARGQGITLIATMSMDLESAENTITLAQSHKGVAAAVGIHPWNAMQPTLELKGRLRRLVKRKNVKAIGEIGLDYVRTPDNAEFQREWFVYELALAREFGLPVNIHCRGALPDMMDILHKELFPGMRGAIHGFSGNTSELNNWLELGFYISVGVRGVVTNEIPELLPVLKQIPEDRLLTETDSAGGEQSTGPAGVVQVAEKLAQLHRTTAGIIGDMATTNLKRFLNT